MFERRRLRVYVAGPISKGDTLKNVHRAIEFGAQLLEDGFAPYVPHLDAYMTLAAAAETPGQSDDWRKLLEWDLEWVSVSDAVFRLSGESVGADLECSVAADLGIPVFREGYVQGGYADLRRLAEKRGLTGVRL